MRWTDRKYWVVAAMLLGSLAEAAVGQTPTPTPTATPVPASGSLEIKYVRDSEEYWTLTRQLYRLAGDAVEKVPKPSSPMGWAVVLDVDETALDNSGYQLERAAYGLTFSPASWRAWVRRAEAPAVPGVKMFLDRVRRIDGSRIAWITDRESSSDSDLDQTAATRENLRKVGLWGDRDLLCTKASNKKKDRRQELAAGKGACSWPGTPIQVVVFVGDQMGDFPGHAEGGATEGETFGYRFFLLPNPMYGGWVSNTTRPVSR